MPDRPSPIVQVELPGTSGNRTFLLPRDELFRIRHIFEHHEYAVPEKFIPSGPLTIVDIGANVGLFALYMKQVLFVSDIYCFEPTPQTLCLLEKNTACDSRIHVFPYALSDRDGSAELRIHPLNSGENTLKSGHFKANRSVQVEMRNAATAFQEIGITYIDILKIDTEGCEVEILKSLQDFTPYVGIIMLEYHSQQDRRAIDKLLEAHLLFDAKIFTTQRGTVKYINSRLVQ